MPRRTKGSLLGPPPSIPMPSMLSNPIRMYTHYTFHITNKMLLLNIICTGIPPSALPPPSMPPPIISPGGRLQWPPNMAPPILPPPHIMSTFISNQLRLSVISYVIVGGPPPPRIYPQKDESWKTPRPSEVP